MPAPKSGRGKAAGSKPAAARAEKKGKKEKSVEWQGLTFTFPPELPEEVLLDAFLVEDGGADARPTFKLINTLLGEDQFAEARNVIATTEATLVDLIELIPAILEQYGVGQGES